MDTSHVTGGAIGAAASALLVALLHLYHVTTLSDADAALVGAAVAAAGVGVAHAVWNVGLGPVASRVLHGPPGKARATALPAVGPVTATPDRPVS